MPDQYNELPWERPGWLEEATAWIEAQLGELGRRRTAQPDLLHQRAWSTFLRVPTDGGTLFFKAPAPPFSQYEARLTEALRRWRPDCTVRVLAVEEKQGWFLSEDAGATLRSEIRGTEQIKHWERVLPQYAELQMQMAPKVPELLGLGMFDWRLSKVPALYAALLQDNENLRVGREPGLTTDEHRRLRKMTPQVAMWCEELGGYGLPETLTHEELHDANVLINGDGYIFTDWSDSSVSHPFFSMLVMIRSAAHHLQLLEGSPELRRVRDAYLEPWSRGRSREDLLRALDLAYHLGMLIRALSWNHGPGALAPQHKEPYFDAVPEWLQDFLNDRSPFQA